MSLETGAVEKEVTLFQIGQFGDLWDSNEQEMEPSLRRMATKKEINGLIECIGEFPKWGVLNEDCKREVIKHLDYKARHNLQLCSKSDYKLVEEVPIYVHKIEMEDAERNYHNLKLENVSSVVVRIQFHEDYVKGKQVQLVFCQNKEDTEIRWLKCLKSKAPELQVVVIKSSNYYKEAVKLVEKWMKKCDYKLNTLHIKMKQFLFEDSQIKFLPRCRQIRIISDSVASFQWWLQRVPEQLHCIQLGTHYQIVEDVATLVEFLLQPRIVNVNRLELYFYVPLTDEQFLSLRARSLHFNSINITDEGINKFIKNWVNGKCVNDFRQAILQSEQSRNISILKEGIELREWDAQFEMEARGFVSDYSRNCGRGNACQISSLVDPFESITLSIHDYCVSIYATGKKVTRNGRIYTKYEIPPHA